MQTFMCMNHRVVGSFKNILLIYKQAVKCFTRYTFKVNGFSVSSIWKGFSWTLLAPVWQGTVKEECSSFHNLFLEKILWIFRTETDRQCHCSWWSKSFSVTAPQLLIIITQLFNSLTNRVSVLALAFSNLCKCVKEALKILLKYTMHSSAG